MEVSDGGAEVRALRVDRVGVWWVGVWDGLWSEDWDWLGVWLWVWVWTWLWTWLWAWLGVGLWTEGWDGRGAPCWWWSSSSCILLDRTFLIRHDAILVLLSSKDTDFCSLLWT